MATIQNKVDLAMWLTSQCRGDRALIGWSQEQLASGVAKATIVNCPIRQVLALLVATWISVGPAFADPEALRQGGQYDHNNEITVCLSSHDAKKFYQIAEGANVYTTGCFPAKLGNFSPMYRVDNITIITQTGVFGFVYGVSESVTPRTGEILHGVPIYIVTSAVVINQNQKEVLVADLN
jgi:hypothetical protein